MKFIKVASVVTSGVLGAIFSGCGTQPSPVYVQQPAPAAMPVQQAPIPAQPISQPVQQAPVYYYVPEPVPVPVPEPIPEPYYYYYPYHHWRWHHW